MKKIIVAALIPLLVAGCASPKWIGNKKYDTYGLFNEAENKNPNIRYQISVGNVFWSIVLVETIIAPIYFVGFDLYEPVGPISEPGVIKSEPGVIDEKR